MMIQRPYPTMAAAASRHTPAIAVPATGLMVGAPSSGPPAGTWTLADSPTRAKATRATIATPTASEMTQTMNRDPQAMPTVTPSGDGRSRHGRRDVVDVVGVNGTTARRGVDAG